MSELARTPLHARHVALGARMVEFAGFSMPVQYTSILDEHAAVRTRAGLFDVSHMGQIHLTGPDAIETAERLLTCPVASLRVGRVRYGLLCNHDGGCVDDVTVYRTRERAVLLCVNAANIAKDLAWMEAESSPGAGLEDHSESTGLLALQGPLSAMLLGGLARPVSDAPAVGDLGRFRFAAYTLADAPVSISRTGYTGSDGFEIYTPADDVVAVFDALYEAGEPSGLVPVGLGARDTLRLEAALPLYGHELDDRTSPLEAGLERFVKREAGGFVGAEAIEARERAGRERQLVGFVVEGRGIARAGQSLVVDGEEVGQVTSGAPSPTLGSPIGLGYVPPRLAGVGQALEVSVRGRGVAARIVEVPFVTKASPMA